MCTYLNKTGATYYFRRPVPDDLLGHFLTERGNARTEWKRSLGSKDREEAKRRLRQHVGETDRLIDDARLALRIAPQASPDALAALEQAREEQRALEELEAESRARKSARSELRTVWHRRKMSSTAELTPEQAAAVDLIRQRDAEVEQLRAALAVMEAGNEKLGIPGRVVLATKEVEARPFPPSGAPKLSLFGLFEDYAESGAATAHTVAKWRAAINAFVEHLGHEDAISVSRADVSGWLKSLVAGGLAVRTVKGTYRAAVARVLKLAHDDGLLAENPAARIEVRGPKATKTKRDDISDDEAQVILAAALRPQPGLGEHHALARRWAPWICAYTGSRITEVTQMRSCDILQEDGVWAFRITPEAGSVKDGEFRLVPIHSHLIEQGVLSLASASDAPLFYDPSAARNPDAVQKQAAQLGSKLAKWVRALGVTEVALPNHGWRHRFKTNARLVGIPADVRDAIQGHAVRTKGESYGNQPIVVLRDAVERLPRYVSATPE
jgi:integrase